MELRLGIEELLLLRHLHHVSKRAHCPGDNGDFLHRLRVFLQRAHKRVAHLMVGNDAAFLLAHDAVLLFLTYKHLLHCLEQILLADIIPALLYRIDSGFIYHIGKIGAYGPAGCQRNGIKIHGVIHQHILGVHLQDFHAALQIRLIHNDLTVKTAGTQKRLIQDFRAVGSAQDQDAPGAVKTIHFRQQLVQRLFTLFIASAVLGITAAADGINFIDKNNTGGVLGGLLKQVTHTGCAHTYVKFDKVGTRQGEKRHMRLSCHRFGQQRLTCSGRSHKQRALGQLGADFGISSRIVQEIHHLHKGFLGFVLSGNILEGNTGFLLYIYLGIALAHAHGTAAAGHFLHQEIEKENDYYKGEHIGQ